MAATYRSHSSGGGTTLAKPSGLTEGDLMLAILTTASFGTGGSVSAATGFSTLTSLTATGQGYLDTYVFIKTATSTDVAASTFNFGGGKGILYSLYGTVTTSTNLQHVIAETTGDLTDKTPPVTDCLLVFFQGNSNNTGDSDTLTTVTLSGGTNPTWTIDYNGSEAGHSLGVAHATYADTSTITSIGGDLQQSDDNVKGYVLIRPNAAATGTNALLSVDPSFFAGTASAGTTGTNALHTVDPTFPTQSGRATTPTQWSNTAKPSTTWTNDTL
jgi:hypothetical protein